MEDYYDGGCEDDDEGTAKKKNKAIKCTKKPEKKEPVGAVAEFDAALAHHFAAAAAAAAAEETEEGSTKGECDDGSNDGNRGYSNEHVSLKFLAAFPEYQNEIRWRPVNKLVVKGKLSPQSGKVLQLLCNKYGSEDAAWQQGWRWHMTEHNHMWYPPQFFDDTKDDDDVNPKLDRKIHAYNTLVDSYSRGIHTKHKGSIASGTGGAKIAAVLKLIDAIELQY